MMLKAPSIRDVGDQAARKHSKITSTLDGEQITAGNAPEAETTNSTTPVTTSLSHDDNITTSGSSSHMVTANATIAATDLDVAFDGLVESQ